MSSSWQVETCGTPCGPCIRAGSGKERVLVKGRVERIVAALNLAGRVPNEEAATEFTDLFAEGAVWGSSNTNVLGKEAIYGAALEALQNSDVTDVEVTIRDPLGWDYQTRSAMVQLGYKATLTQPRPFTPGSTATLPAGTTFEQDLYGLFRFDCDWELVFYRLFGNPTQTSSSYLTPGDFPPACVGPRPIKPCPITKGSASDRAKAESVAAAFNNALNVLATNGRLASRLFSGLFAEKGVWSYDSGHATGPFDIQIAFLEAFVQNPTEEDQSSKIHQIFWDYETRTLAILGTWTATLTEPRAFVPGSTQQEPAGFTYQHEDFNFVRLDCYSETVIFRSYASATQTSSTYTAAYPPVCVLEGTV